MKGPYVDKKINHFGSGAAQFVSKNRANGPFFSTKCDEQKKDHE
jgi:hypothetical protein